MTHPNSEFKKRIVAAHSSGTSIAQLSTLFGYHRNSIRTWIELANSRKSFDRSKNSGSGRPSKFKGKLGQQLLKMIEKPASHFNFETDFWTTARIKRVCKDYLKLDVSRMAVHRALIKFEQSYKKPQKNISRLARTSKMTGLSMSFAKLSLLSGQNGQFSIFWTNLQSSWRQL
jgi:transposase